MASRSTVKYKLYDRFLDPNGVSVLTLEDRQDAISGIIENIKIGNNSHEVLEKTKTLAEELIREGAQGIIVGCTEISLILKDGDMAVPVFDSNAITARRCVQMALKAD